jgi:error-prone DNA polymerase
MSYAELHCVSNFSFLRGASHPQELIEQAAALGYTALAITDECSMAGIVRAYEATKANNFQLIVGSEFRTIDDMHVVLLAPTQQAYAQICGLITLGRRRAAKGRYQLSRADFQSGLNECLALWIPAAHPTLSQALLMKAHFPDRCWIAVELHRDAGDAQRLAALRRLADRSGLPMVAAGDVHMHVRERRLLQDTVTAIRHGCSLAEAGFKLFPNGERHLRSLDELQRLYPRELLNETLRVAERCRFSMGSLQYSYPAELVPKGLSAEQYLRELVNKGCKARWPGGVPTNIAATIEAELTLISKLKYEHFFLTVEDIVRYAREQNILCQGRGSSANSIVCYALGITAADPEKIGLLFGRFLSEERNEPPDIDVDFEHERREEVIQYVYDKYGRERAAIAATVITYKSRSAIRDAGKALGLASDTVDQLAKLQAYWDDEHAFKEHLTKQGLQLDSHLIRQLCYLVKTLKYFPRHLSQHVGGFVIADEPISQLVPIENAAMDGRTIIQWDKNDLETLGLLKVDVLALGMLTALRKSFEFLNNVAGAPTSFEQIPDDDKLTYDMICKADTVGVFQIESRAQMSMLPRLQPRKYYDLVVEVAIVRPGPIEGGMVHPYLNARRNPDAVEYPSPALKEVLKRTLGVPIFQEQVMEIVMRAAGFTVGEADHVRRSMAAWQRSGSLGQFRQKLIDGMLARNYTREFAERIFKQIEGFAEYGFPESHAASFALLTYYSSYLKCHYPAAFFAALINSQPMGFYSPRQLLEAAKRQNVEVLPVDIGVSAWLCTLEFSNNQHAIRLGLCLINGVREVEVERIIIARTVQPFLSIDDVAHRASLSVRCIKTLSAAGALRSITANRHTAMWNALGVERLPALLAGHSAHEDGLDLPVPTTWEEMTSDYRHMGLSDRFHPLKLLRPLLQRRGICSRQDLDAITNGTRVRVCGLVTHLQHPQTAKGVVFASLEDEFGIHNIIFWPTVFDAYRYVLLKATLIVITGRLQSQENVINVIAEAAEDCSHWASEIARHSRDFQ